MVTNVFIIFTALVDGSDFDFYLEKWIILIFYALVTRQNTIEFYYSTVNILKVGL